jgi:uncharacterized protein (TIGR03067 family)
MQASRNSNSSYSRYVELLFSQEGTDGWAAQPPHALTAGRHADPPRQPPAPPEAPAEPPATIENATDLRAAQAWFQAERARLEEYAQDQFSNIQDQHQEALARQYQKEAELAKREREIHREVKFLAAQAEALRERARGLAEWETSLKAQSDQLSRLEEQAAAIPDAAGQVSLVAPVAPGPEVSQVRLSEAAAREKFEAVDAMIRERLEAWEKKQAEVLARQEQMELRYRDLELAEQAVARRMAELDQLEDGALASQAQRQRWKELEQRFHELEQAEAALARRMAELDEVEERARAPEPRPDRAAQEAVRREQEKLAGAWRLVAVETNGQAAPTEAIDDIRFVFTGDQLTRQRGDRAETAAAYRVDPSRDPKWMDMTGSAEGREYVIPAVYSLTGDTLMLCYRADYKRISQADASRLRPTRIDAAGASAQVLLTLRRERV